MKQSEQDSFEGFSTCVEQVISAARIVYSAEVWSCLQNNNNNEYYLSLGTGAYNNNNKNNNYWVVPIESGELVDLVFEAEADCWRNKHSSWDAAKYHYHGGRIWKFIERLGKGEYEIWKSICFIILYPKPREIFAAHYEDRIAHHIVCPYMRYIAECVHKANGNVSFGNRKGMSAWHACLRVQKKMQEHPNGYVASFDISSFFMSIDKEIALQVYERYEEKYRPSWIGDNMRRFILELTRMMVRHNPATNCDRRSPERLWGLIPHCKSLFFMNGLPIGNFYAQLLANLILAIVCELIDEETEFVDDFCVVADAIVQIHKAERLFREGLAILHLKQSMNKVYIQPVRHGIKWCGYVIRKDRMYVSNRPIRNCYQKMDEYLKDVSLSNARNLVCSLNSYVGMFCHCAEYNTQKRICDRIMHSGYKRYVYFRKKHNSLICTIKPRYERGSLSVSDIKDIDSYRKQKCKVL